MYMRTHMHMRTVLGKLLQDRARLRHDNGIRTMAIQHADDLLYTGNTAEFNKILGCVTSTAAAELLALR